MLDIIKYNIELEKIKSEVYQIQINQFNSEINRYIKNDYIYVEGSPKDIENRSLGYLETMEQISNPSYWSAVGNRRYKVYYGKDAKKLLSTGNKEDRNKFFMSYTANYVTIHVNMIPTYCGAVLISPVETVHGELGQYAVYTALSSLRGVGDRTVFACPLFSTTPNFIFTDALFDEDDDPKSGFDVWKECAKVLDLGVNPNSGNEAELYYVDAAALANIKDKLTPAWDKYVEKLCKQDEEKS